MQSFDQNDMMVSDIQPVTSLDEIIEELKKPDVKYVKVFMYEGEPNIKKQIPASDALLRAVSGDLDNLNKMADNAVSKMNINE